MRKLPGGARIEEKDAAKHWRIFAPTVTQWGCPQPARVTRRHERPIRLFAFCREADHLARRPDALLHDIPRCWLQASGRSTAIGATGQLQCSVAELRLPQAAASGWDGRRPEPCGRAAGGAANSGGWQGRRPLARRPNGPAPIFRSGTAGLYLEDNTSAISFTDAIDQLRFVAQESPSTGIPQMKSANFSS